MRAEAAEVDELGKKGLFVQLGGGGACQKAWDPQRGCGRGHGGVSVMEGRSGQAKDQTSLAIQVSPL